MSQAHYDLSTPPFNARRRWRLLIHGSIRSKLITTCLAVTILGVFSIAFVIYTTTRVALMGAVAQNLHNAASDQAQAVEEMFAREVDMLRAFALSKVVQDDVTAFGQRYRGDSAAIEAEIRMLDQRWQQAEATDSLIQSRLKNTVAYELRESSTTFPYHVEVIVTDQFGSLIGATNRNSDSIQADKA